MPPEYTLDPLSLDLSRVLADAAAIERVNPQRFEMMQLTAIVLLEPSQGLIAGYKDVGHEEFWVRGHVPGNPLMPGVMQLEAAAQLCSYYSLVQKQFDTDFVGLGGMEEVRFRAPVRPGDRLVLIGKQTKLHRRQTTCRVQGFVGPAMAFHVDIIGMPLGAGRRP